MFECPAHQGLRDGYKGLFGDHGAIVVQFMWQHDTRAVAKFIKECMDAHAHGDPGPQSRALDQALAGGSDAKSLPLSCIFCG